MTSRTLRVAIALFTIAVTTACDRSKSISPHETLTSLAPLRQVFNADSGKVRAIFLASPT
jgi:hypothetical protein